MCLDLQYIFHLCMFTLFVQSCSPGATPAKGAVSALYAKERALSTKNCRQNRGKELKQGQQWRPLDILPGM